MTKLFFLKRGPIQRHYLSYVTIIPYHTVRPGIVGVFGAGRALCAPYSTLLLATIILMAGSPSSEALLTLDLGLRTTHGSILHIPGTT